MYSKATKNSETVLVAEELSDSERPGHSPMHLLPGLQRCRREERHRNAAATDRRRLKLDVICEMIVAEEVLIDSKQRLERYGLRQVHT